MFKNSCTYTSKFAFFVLIDNYAVVDYSVTGILYQYNYNEKKVMCCLIKNKMVNRV